MTFDEFWAAYEPMNFKKKDSVFVHCRIGTSGNKDGGNTHPFPAVRDYELMRALEYETEHLVIHNGVVGSGEGIASDTMKYVKNIIAPLVVHIEEDGIYEIMDDLLKVTSNRWVVTHKNDIYFFGGWVTAENKQIFSNTGYKEYKVKHDTTVKTYAYGWGRNYSQNPPEAAGSGAGRTDSRHSSEIFHKNGKFKSEEWLATVRELVLKAGNKTVVHETRVHHTSEEDEDGNFIIGYINNEGKIEWDDAEIDKTVSEDGGVTSQHFMFCPECDEDNRLIDSPFNYGDVCCLNCGAVFSSVTGEIFMYDEDIRASYQATVPKTGSASKKG